MLNAPALEPAAEAAAEPQTVEPAKSADEWTVVPPKRRQNTRKKTKNSRRQKCPGAVEVQLQVDAGDSGAVDEDQVARTVQQVTKCLLAIHTSLLFSRLMQQHRAHLTRNTAIICYGIGDIRDSAVSRVQLALAMALAEELAVVTVEFFDPVLSADGAAALATLGISQLQMNEQCRRTVSEPTLFYMPHCDREMYDNVIAANRQIVDGYAALIPSHTVCIIGNRFSTYADRAGRDVAVRRCTHLLWASASCAEV